MPRLRRILLAHAGSAGLSIAAFGEPAFGQQFGSAITTVQSPSLAEQISRGAQQQSQTTGTAGSNGSNAGFFHDASPGTRGGQASPVTIQSQQSFNANNQNAYIIGGTGGVGGKGGNVGRGDSGNGAYGAVGGTGAVVTIDNRGNLIVSNGSGIIGYSIGGHGGKGGEASALEQTITSGAGGNGGSASTITATNIGRIETVGNQGLGIFLQASGGAGGTAGNADGDAANSTAGRSGNGGDGGIIDLTNTGLVSTNGTGSDAIHAISLGGSGANAAQAKSLRTAVNGIAGQGGNGKSVTINNSGMITVHGAISNGIVAKSVGGAGGHGNNVTPGGTVSSHAANGAGGGVGGTIEIINSGTLVINEGTAIYAGSFGGEGGRGGYSITGVSSPQSGNGGAGGNASQTVVKNDASITTVKASSNAIVAVSKGGNGGNAGVAVSFTRSPTAGSGGDGGNGAKASVTNKGEIVTSGSASSAITASSSGGTGGNGGLAVGAATAKSGNGGKGGNAGEVFADNRAMLTINGETASAIVAHSQGGEGGNSGWSLAGGSATSGNGGTGGNASLVTVINTGQITTHAQDSNAIIALSSGGKGGNGGFSLAGGAATSGSGAKGGAGGNLLITNSGNITTNGANSSAIFAGSIGGGGGNSGWSFAVGNAVSGAGGAGGAAGTVQIDTTADVTTHGNSSIGVSALSLGGNGGNGGFSLAGGAATSGSGAKGGAGGNLRITNTGNITTNGANSSAIFASSIGGGGGNSGWSFAVGNAVSGAGGAGGAAGTVQIDTTADVTTHGNSSVGVSALSLGGNGGNGGFSLAGGAATSGSGAKGGTGGNLRITNSGNITTNGANSSAIFAGSIGGGGGNSGWSFAVGNAVSGAGGAGGAAGTVQIDTTADVTTHGNSSVGVSALSLGGNGGNAGFSLAGGVATSGNGGEGGKSGSVTITNAGTVLTKGSASSAIVGASSGGSGGNAGWSAAIGKATSGKGGKGGAAGTVTIGNSGSVFTEGYDSSAIIATSNGGKGGNGGLVVGVSASSGGGGIGGSATNVTVSNEGTITTSNSSSLGIIAQSNGGAGGSGGLHISVSSNGGDGGVGGAAGAVTVTNSGTIVTGLAAESDHHLVSGSAAIIAQSLGGAGGNSGSNFTGLPIISGSQGGTAGSGGAAGNVIINLKSTDDPITQRSLITTWGDDSAGLIAQSMGGKGGDGGLTVSLAAGPGALATTLGTIGGHGGHSGNIIIGATGTITTHGDHSVAILANSIGGDGGNGGLTIGGAASTTLTGAASASRQGGDGGNAGTVAVTNSATINTKGDQSSAIIALSQGGKGGQGGSSGSLAATTLAAGSFTVAGNGGAGGNAGSVNVHNTGSIITIGHGSAGILAQSEGGQGGDGGKALAISAATGGALSLSIGGKGGAGGGAGVVTVGNSGNITTSGDGSSAIIAMSRAGNAGKGEGNATIGLASSGSVAFAGGNDGGSGGAAQAVTVENTGTLITSGHSSFGIDALSQGGTGGTGGNSINLAVAGIASLSGGWSGKGGAGGAAAAVNVENEGSIVTAGDQATALSARSLGGDGGAGGLAVTVGLVAFPDLPTGTSAVGYAQAGGNAGTASDVTITSRYLNRPLGNDATIATFGEDSAGLFALSAGGNGGDGGLAGAFAGSFGPTTLEVSVAIAGNGGDGASGGNVSVTSFDNLLTTGNRSSAIIARTSGGDGGNGAHAGAATLGASASSKTYGGFTAIGGSGGNAGIAGNVAVSFEGLITSLGDQSHGIQIETTGGNGGNAGSTAGLGVSVTPDGVTLGGSVSGAGGNGGKSGTANVDFTGTIITNGMSSSAIIANAKGGSGGEGGVSFSAAIGQAGANNLAVSWGRGAGNGGIAGDVVVNSDGIIITQGAGSDAVIASSTGGKGGTGTYSIAATASAQSTASNNNLSVAVGGAGGSGAEAGSVTINNKALIYSTAASSRGMVAISQGGSGGDGGTSLAAAANLAGIQSGQSRIGLITIAGRGGDGAAGGMVDLTNEADIFTDAENSTAILAHSLGGQGGKGGEANVAHLLFKAEVSDDDDASEEDDPIFPSANTYQFLMGGTGGHGGNSDAVTVVNASTILTKGDASLGIDAQSTGGSGGNGSGTSLIYSASDIPIEEINKYADKDADNWIIGTGGVGGAGRKAGNVDVANNGLIITEGSNAAGITARSIGGSGGHSGDGGLEGGSVGIGGAALTEIIRSVGDAIETPPAALQPVFEWAHNIGTGGDGADVKVENGIAGNISSGTIYTAGANSTAIIAETRGGNGGNGGDGTGKIALGGDGGRAGNAGKTQVSNHGYLITEGENSAGISAYAIGGKGGLGGNASSGGEKDEAYLTFGGRGGAGGKAGVVTVSNYGTIITAGQGATGIFAQSEGGDGGNSGSGTAQYFGVGGGLLDTILGKNVGWLSSSGTGGDGAEVIINNGMIDQIGISSIYTIGDNASAIQAESFGGAGGAGGNATGYVAFAGDGGIGGNSSTVSITNYGNLLTAGTASAGMIARTKGGMGGDGGHAGTSDQPSDILTLPGRGGAGGNADNITIANSGLIITLGDDAGGILAQSAGGNGGNAGNSHAKYVGFGGAVADILLREAAQWAGSNGAGGAAGDIVITNGQAGLPELGNIATFGNNASAIQAESLGGAGGAGGNATGYVAFAGDGGIGGTAGTVQIDNHAVLFTEGDSAFGIKASSVGGAGGNGGSVGSADSRTGYLTLGGRAGKGADASIVTINNSGIIHTIGNGSGAILAQSIGGEGGNAGESYSNLFAAGGASFDGIINARAAWYGRTGHGGDAKSVTVTNGLASNQQSGFLVSQGHNASLITAQSIGGQGGAGGNASGLIQFNIPEISEYQTVIGIAFAGDAGLGGDAASVVVENYGLLASSGDYSSAIIAQSIGGQGGNGGNATTINTEDNTLINVTAAAGGLAGTGGKADTVSVYNYGSIHTSGGEASGIIAHSLGGNGGIAGTAEASLAFAGGALSHLTGAPNGAGGDSGDVVVVNGSRSNESAHFITTVGENANAIYAKTKGGNGSNGGETTGLIGLGGNGGDGGDAATISVENYAALFTQGNNATAIRMESTGGKGGIASASSLELLPIAQNGVAGKAGAISLDNFGDIITNGTASSAISALSQGLSAGDVVINNTASLMTFGDLADALTVRSIASGEPTELSASQFALRAGPGSGAAGNVTIRQDGHVIATGAGSSAIVAQSSGASQGNIDIMIAADSLIIGGKKSGAGVSIIDGAQTSINNHGTITALGDITAYIQNSDRELVAAGWVDGVALRGTNGNMNIFSSNLVSGSIELGAGNNQFTNSQGAWLLSGSTIGLGSGEEDKLFNHGYLAPGGIGYAFTTEIDGNLIQSEGAAYHVDINFAAVSDDASSSAGSYGKADRLNVSGRVELAGRLPVSVTNIAQARSGKNEYVVVDSDDGIHNRGLVLEAPNTAVASYSIEQRPNQTILSVDVDYAPHGLTENGIAVATAVNYIQQDQSSPNFWPIATALFSQPDIASLQRAYDLISGEGTAGAQQAYFSESNAFIAAIGQQTSHWRNQSSAEYATEDTSAFPNTRWRTWFSGFGNAGSLDGDPFIVGSGDLKSYGKGAAAGIDYQLNSDTLLGIAFGAGDTRFSVSDRLTEGEINTGRFAAYASHTSDNFYFDGLIGVDWFNVDTVRTAAIAPNAFHAGMSDWLRNDFSGYGFNMRLEGGYRIELGGVQFTPFAALQLSSFRMNGSVEQSTSNDNLALYYEDRTVYSVPLSIGARFDAHTQLSDQIRLDAYVKAAWVHEFADKRSVKAGFTTAPGYEFVVHGAAASRNSAELEAGFDMKIDSGLSLYGKVTGNFSSSGHNISGSGGFRLRW